MSILAKGLTRRECAALAAAGFSAGHAEMIARRARQTGWLGLHRLLHTSVVSLAIILPVIVITQFSQRLGLGVTALIGVLIFSPVLVLLVWRIALRLIDPDGAGVRRAIALAIEAASSTSDPAGWAQSQLADLARSADAAAAPAELASNLAALRRKSERYEWRFGLIMGGIVLAFGLIVGAPLLLSAG